MRVRKTKEMVRLLVRLAERSEREAARRRLTTCARAEPVLEHRTPHDQFGDEMRSARGHAAALGAL